MDEAEAKEIISNVMKDRGIEFEPESLRIRYFQDDWGRLDAYGEFLNREGYFEFAISVEDRKKVKRFHVNLIMPRSVFEETKKLKRE
ncbi:MAG: hypothetical protein ACP5HQ_00535 [Thermoprotei archaeon]